MKGAFSLIIIGYANHADSEFFVWEGVIIKSPNFLKNSDDVMRGGVLLACHHGLSDDMLMHMHDVCDTFFQQYL